MLEGFQEWGYLGLFIASFLAATVLPFSSEAVFSGLIIAGLDHWTCIFVATLGNSLGGMTCYWLGHLGKIEWIEKYSGVKKAKLEKWVPRMQKHGDWLAFFAFLPGIGDIIAVACGFVRSNVWIVATTLTLGKFARYIVWMYMHVWLLS